MTLVNRFGGHRQVATLLTQVIVDADDPAFATPEKRIGPGYEETVAKQLAAERGWTSRTSCSGTSARCGSVASLTQRDGAEVLGLAPRVPVRTQVTPHPLEAAGQTLEDHGRCGDHALRLRVSREGFAPDSRSQLATGQREWCELPTTAVKE